MKKSVYSLVLNDSVVAAADRAATKQGISRSSLINQILATHLSCATPQMLIHDIFEGLEQLTQYGNFRMQSQPSNAMMSLLTSLSYKYRPTVRYAVSLTQQADRVIGTLKVGFRTQSLAFVDVLADFFYFFCRLEKAFAPNGVEYNIEPGKFSRLMLFPAVTRHTATEISDAISGYIKMFDDALNAYFNHLPNKKRAYDAVANVYQNYINHTTIRI